MICGICRERAGEAIRYGNIPMCNECWSKESNLSAGSMTPKQQMERVKLQNEMIMAGHPFQSNAGNKSLNVSQQIDASIQVRADIFNSKIEAINDLKAVIASDANITNKPYALAEILTTRFHTLSSVMFDAQETIMDGANEQKAIQSYLNDLANKLRDDERAQLKIADIKYQPNPVKSPTIRKITTSGPKISKAPAHRQNDFKALMAKAVKELGVSDFIIQQVITQKGCSIDEAVSFLKQQINQMKANSANLVKK